MLKTHNCPINKIEKSDSKKKDLPLIRREKKEKKKVLDVDSLIKFEIKSRYEKIQRKKVAQKIPLMMTVLSDEVEVDEDRVGLDLIIMIDISGSMGGEKIKLVKSTLLFIVEQLCEIDRLGLTTFSNTASVLRGLTPMTKENKEEFRKEINKLYPSGGTNIQEAVKQAMDMMTDRQEVNETTAIFLLSDGQDTCGGQLDKLKEIMREKDKLLKELNMNYKFHSFGYGLGHDEVWLSAISNFKNGSFYYVKENKMINDCFIDCLGSLLSIIAKDVKINVFLDKNCKFVRKFGESWNNKEDKEKGVVLVDNIISDNDKDYVAEIEVGLIPQNITEIKIAIAMINYKSDSGDGSKSQTLLLKVVDDENLGEINQKVEETFAKFEAGDEIKKYDQLVSLGKKKEADIMIDHFNQKLGSNNYLHQNYKDKILSITKKEKLEDRKWVEQNYHIMCEDMYAPGFSNFKAQRSKARHLMK